MNGQDSLLDLVSAIEIQGGVFLSRRVWFCWEDRGLLKDIYIKKTYLRVKPHKGKNTYMMGIMS